MSLARRLVSFNKKLQLYSPSCLCLEKRGWLLQLFNLHVMTESGAAADSAALPSSHSVLAEDEELDQGRVLSIQSHVVHGYVGNKSATFPLQLLGFDVDPVNSVHFSNHTGYPGGFAGDVLKGEQLWALYEGLKKNGLAQAYTHVLTGYIGAVDFLRTVVRLVCDIRAQNPDSNVPYYCDPVLGDNGKCYVPQALIEVCVLPSSSSSLLSRSCLFIARTHNFLRCAPCPVVDQPCNYYCRYKSEVLSVATVITPNQFECELLTGIKIENAADLSRTFAHFHARGIRTVVITSLENLTDAPFNDSGTMYMVASDVTNPIPAPRTSSDSEESSTPTLQATKCHFLAIPKIPAYFTGTGDLTAALLLAWLRKTDNDVATAMERACASIQAVLSRTWAHTQAAKAAGQTSTSSTELRLVQSAKDILHPPVVVSSPLTD